MKILIFYTFMLFMLCTTSCTKKCSEAERDNHIIESKMLITSNSILFNQTDTAINLGDTLFINVEIPFDNFSINKNIAINVQEIKMSMFAIDYRIINEGNNGQVFACHDCSNRVRVSFSEVT